ncbi:L-type lectin-domain containing receptor kinase IX.1-like [Populus alba x Populus x berolinensis]|uniref:L-type lectin-domain containing receptor kinase IX.1-like n=1 Tax=Populus alba x Populus x berolinensis TaxID=444605 RepID=A0AAD6R798_9ROSI|nr:L-type lectin-domain containing receptor kinase IX.1-like [Populus alba x Populus x berolinensis]
MTTSFYSFQTLNLYVISFLLLLLPPSANSVSFQRTRFDPSDTSIIFEGGASAHVGSIEFNSDTYICQVGRATYAEKVPLWDSSTTRLTDFSTQFSFYIDIEGRTSYAAGFAFFIAPVEFHIPPNSAGGFLGLYNITTSDSQQNHIVHIEFDSFANPEWDPPIQHVGINNNSVSSATYTYWNTSLHSGDTADVRITYNSTAKNLTVSWKYRATSTPQENTSLSYIIDLREVLPEWVTIGFTAATSNLIERHVLQSWDFSSTLEMSETSGKSAKNIKLVVSLTVSGAVLIIVIAVVSGILWRRRKLVRKKTAETVNLTSINDDLERRAGPRRFSYKFDENQMECLMIVGLWCAHPDRNIRPSIRQAIHVLNFEAPLPNLPTKMPVPLYHVPTPSLSSGEPLISHSMDVGR